MTDRETRVGAIYAIGAYLFWGLSPLYWRLIESVPADLVLAHRVIWSVPCVVALLTLNRRWSVFRDAVRTRRTLLTLALSMLLVAANWFVFIYAVYADRVIEASLGYFINPLVSVFLGFLVLREGMRPAQWFAVALATIGVTVLTIRLGELPWIALVLAFSFGLYGLLRKTVRADATVGLSVEVMLITPLAIGWFLHAQSPQPAALWADVVDTRGLLVLGGLVTVTPLIWFTNGARRLPLTTIGLLQYVAPSVQFLLAVFLFGETFTPAHAVAFGFIWAALAVYTIEARRRYLRAMRGLAAAEAGAES